MAKTYLYCAKVNVNENIFIADQEVEEIISKKIPEQVLAFSTDYIGKFIKEKDNEGQDILWTLADTTLVDSNTIIGSLTKSRPLIYDSLNSENRLVEKSPENELDTDAAFFIYFIKEEIVTFKTNRNISRNAFIQKFKDMLEFEKGMDNIGEVEVILLTKSDEIRSILLSHKVTKINIEVVHPNSRKKQYKRMQEIIRKSKSKKTKLALQNNDGLTVREESTDELTDILQESLQMTEDGYGSITISYYEGKKIKTSSTSDDPVKIPIAKLEEGTSVQQDAIIEIATKLHERKKD